LNWGNVVSVHWNLRLALVCLASAAALAGCAPKSAGVGPGAAQGAGPQLTEADMPHPKSGLWDIKSAATGDTHTCLSGQLLNIFAVRSGCNQISRQHSADGGLVMDSQCSGSSATHVSASGDYQSAFQVDMTLSGGGMGSMKDHVDYRYLGDCTPGQHPDDKP